MRTASLYVGGTAAGVALALFAASCRGSDAPVRPALVACAPGIAEIVRELGSADALVGVDAGSKRLPGLERARDLGEGCRDAVDALPSLHADLVLVLGTPQGRALAASLGARGQAVQVFAPRSLDEVIDVYLRLGAVIAEESSAQRALARLTREISSVAVRRDGKRRLRIAWLVGRDPLTAVGGEGMLHEMLELAGAENAFHGMAAERIPVTPEAVAASAPDLVLDSGGSGLPATPIDPGLAELPALDPLPRIRALHALLYPGA